MLRYAAVPRDMSAQQGQPTSRLTCFLSSFLLAISAAFSSLDIPTVLCCGGDVVFSGIAGLARPLFDGVGDRAENVDSLLEDGESALLGTLPFGWWIGIVAAGEIAPQSFDNDVLGCEPGFAHGSSSAKVTNMNMTTISLCESDIPPFGASTSPKPRPTTGATGAVSNAPRERFSGGAYKTRRRTHSSRPDRH